MADVQSVPNAGKRKFNAFIQSVHGDALQQTISRIFAIIVRQAFDVRNVTLMQTTDNGSDRMEEDVRIEQQLQLLINK